MNNCNVKLLNLDELGHIFSFLPMEDTAPEQVNKNWRESLKVSVSYYLKPFTEHLEWGRIHEWYTYSYSKQEALIRRFIVRSHPNSIKIGGSILLSEWTT